MRRIKKWKQGFFCLAAAIVLSVALVLVAPAQTVSADSPRLYSANIHTQLHSDGSATITEIWDVRVVEGTEFYLVKYNLDNMDISDFSVRDENGTVFENVGAWNVNRTLDQKAGQCGMVATNGGYELCWGVGSYGDHTYTVQYTVTNIIKGYNGGDIMRWVFVSHDMMTKVEDIQISISADEHTLSYPENTGVWVFNFSADYGFENGSIWVRSDRAMKTSERAAVMVEFETGMFNLADIRNESADSIKEAAFDGSDYSMDSGSSGGSYGVSMIVRSAMGPLVMVTLFAFFIAAMARAGRSSYGSGSKKRLAAQYKQAPYHRELPFNGSLPASYSRLKELGQLSTDGDIIGAYLLRWIRNGQVEIVKQPAGFLGRKEEDAIKLYTARQTMESKEMRLYDMLCKAAGSDWILQSKEFEKWSRRNYHIVESWLNSYNSGGKTELTNMGAATQTEQAHFFGLYKTKQTVMTPLGEEMTMQMFGFKNYLKDFTIINERQAREVELWEDYLVFAQLFGIADEVANQFSALYPDYFTNPAAGYGYGRPMTVADIIIINHISRSYSRAMYNGYRAGYSAAHSGGGGGSSSMGGGGFSGGGGGGFSGGGGGGGSR